MPHEKNCGVCRRLLPLTAFYKASGASDGHQARCKDCHLQRVRAYRARLRARNAANPPASEVKKRCPRCGLTKPGSDFHRNAASRYGRHWVCKNATAWKGRTLGVQNGGDAFVGMTSNRKKYKDFSPSSLAAVPFAAAPSSTATTTSITVMPRARCEVSCVRSAIRRLVCSPTTSPGSEPRLRTSRCRH